MKARYFELKTERHTPEDKFVYGYHQYWKYINECWWFLSIDKHWFNMTQYSGYQEVAKEKPEDWIKRNPLMREITDSGEIFLLEL